MSYWLKRQDSMNNTSIITIGNEILIGHTVNTNAAYLAERLLSIGIPVVSEHTVGDCVGRIVQAFRLAADEADLILVTGGLGPTEDDLTRQALAQFLKVDLQFDEGLFREIEERFKKRGIVMSSNNKMQAFMPAGTTALENKIGTAAGIKASWQGKLFFVMPGVPYEMRLMFEDSVLPEIGKLADKKAGRAVAIKKLNCFGAGESQIAEMLSDVGARDRNPQINYTVNFGIVTVHITAEAESIKEATKMAKADEQLIRKRLGSLVFSTGEQGLAEVVGRLLAERKKTLATAESCTGGLLAGLITDIAGASRYFTHGWITYSNKAKMSELDVPAELIGKYGAVSEEVASAMAKGARKRAGTDYTIAITGIAGPGGGTEQKPVGLVYISVEGGGIETKRFVFAGDRNSIRIRAANTALNMLRGRLQID